MDQTKEQCKTTSLIKELETYCFVLCKMYDEEIEYHTPCDIAWERQDISDELKQIIDKYK